MKPKVSILHLLVFTAIVAIGFAAAERYRQQRLKSLQSELEFMGVHLFSLSDVERDVTDGHFEPWNEKFRKYEGPIVLVMIVNIDVTDELIEKLRCLPNLEQIVAFSISQQERDRLRSGLGERIRIFH